MYRKKNNWNMGQRLLLLSVLCFLLAAIGVTYAFLSTKTQNVTNQFDPVTVTCAVEEQFDGAEHRAVNDAENSARLLQIVKSGQFPEKSRKIRAFFGQKDKETPKISAFADLLKSMN